MTTANLHDLSTTDGNNTSVAGINQAESGMKVSDVNGAFRALDGSIARWLSDMEADAATSGTTTITATLAQPYTDYGTDAGEIPDGTVVRLKMTNAASGASTLNFNSIGAKKARRIGDIAVASGDWGAGDVVTWKYYASYDSATGAWAMVDKTANVYVMSGGKFDFGAGNWVATHSSGVLTVGTGDLRITTAGTNSASVVTVGGTQTLTNKGLTAPSMSGTIALASGTVFSWNSGDVTQTHSANLLAWAGASSGYTFDKQVSSTGTGNRFYANDMGTSGDFAYVARASSGVGTRYAMVTINNADSTVGSITFDAASTAYNTSSDENIKQGFEDFDSAAIIDGLHVYHYEWKAAPGRYGYGVKAQEAVSVFPQMISVGSGTYGEPGYKEWGADYSKLVPVLLREIQSMRVRLAALES